MRFLESFGFGQRAPDVLRAQIASIAIEITNRCNLRCSYCHKADAGLEALPGSNDDMPPSRVLELYRYVKAANVRSVSLSVGGETTTVEGWHQIVAPFLDDPEIKTHMVSNFSRRLDAAELSALSKLDTLQISFDSSDREMVRNLRSKADLQTITYNIIRLRQVAHDAGRTPFILVNCVLSRDNIGHLADLAGFCRALGVNQLMICEVTPVSSVTPEKTKLLDALTDDEVILLARQIMDATAMLSEGPTSLLLRDHLKARIGDVIEQLSAGATPVSPAAQFHRSMVKSACPMPWTSPMVKANGRVIACCGPAFLDIGVLDGRQTLGDIVEGAKARAIRSAILDGRPTVGCETCTLVLPTSFSEFKHYIEGRYGCASTITGCSEEPKILSPSP